MKFVGCSSSKYPSSDGRRFLIWPHDFKMAAMTSFHAEKCCHLAYAVVSSVPDLWYTLHTHTHTKTPIQVWMTLVQHSIVMQVIKCVLVGTAVVMLHHTDCCIENYALRSYMSLSLLMHSFFSHSFSSESDVLNVTSAGCWHL